MQMIALERSHWRSTASGTQFKTVEGRRFDEVGEGGTENEGGVGGVGEFATEGVADGREGDEDLAALRFDGQGSQETGVADGADGLAGEGFGGGADGFELGGGREERGSADDVIADERIGTMNDER